jgi:tetratricopeptide (TPR) repeat protein
MQLYRYNNKKWFGVAVGLLVVATLLFSFALIFRWLPMGGNLPILWEFLRFSFGVALVFSWVVLNTAPPRPPGFVIAFAELGEEKEYEGAEEGLIRQARRALPLIGTKVAAPDYDEDEPVSVGSSRFLAELRRNYAAPAIARLASAKPVRGALPAPTTGGIKSAATVTALALAERNGKLAADGSMGLDTMRPNRARLPVRGEKIVNEFGEEEQRPAVKKAVPPDAFFAWELAVGARNLSLYLQTRIMNEFRDAELKQLDGKDAASLFPLVFAKYRENVLREAEVPQADMVIWGWNLYRKRRDYVPVFELPEPLENRRPARGQMQILGLKSFDLGLQTARHSTIIASFIAGLGAYGFAGETPDKNEHEYYLKARNEFNLALTASYMYGDPVPERPQFDRAILYFFLGNTNYYLGELEAAVNAYTQALTLDRELIEAQHNLGVVLFLQNKLDYALKNLVKVIQLRPNLAVARLNLAVVFLSKKQHSSARRELQNALELNENYAAAYRVMGVTFREEREYAKALQYFQQAIEVSPMDKYAEARVDMGLIYEELAKSETVTDDEAERLFNQAMQELSIATRDNPNLPEAHYELGRLLDLFGEEDEASVSLHDAVKLRPNYSEAHELLAEIYERRGRTDLRDYHLEQMMKARQAIAANTPEELVRQAIGLRRNGNLEGAREQLEKALRLDPRHPQALFEMGIVYQEIGEYQKALENYQTVLKLPAPPDETYNRVGNLLFQQEKRQEAMDFLRNAVTQKPNNPWLHYYLGNLHRKQKTDGKAIESYITAIKLNPDMAEPHFNLGMIYMNRKQLNDAILQFREVVRIRPEDYDTYLFLGRAYMRNGQVEQAITALEEAISIKADLLEARLLLSEIFLRKADAEQAIEQLQVVQTLDPNDMRARELMGKAYAQAGQLDKAIATFQDILSINSDSPSAYYNLGVAFVSLRRYREAVKAFEQVIRIKPDDADAYFNMGVALHELLNGPEQNTLEAAEIDGFFNKEVMVFSKASQLSPTNPEPYRYLGQLYMRINNTELGKKYFDQYQRLKRQSS